MCLYSINDCDFKLFIIYSFTTLIHISLVYSFWCWLMISHCICIKFGQLSYRLLVSYGSHTSSHSNVLVRCRSFVFSVKFQCGMISVPSAMNYSSKMMVIQMSAACRLILATCMWVHQIRLLGLEDLVCQALVWIYPHRGRHHVLVHLLRHSYLWHGTLFK